MQELERFHKAIRDIQFSHTVKQHVGEMHNHDGYEIYLFLGGDVDYLVERTKYTMQPGDMLLIRHDEFHQYILKSDRPYEKMSLRFQEEAFRILAESGTELLHCFIGRGKGERNRIKLNNTQLQEIQSGMRRIAELSPESYALRLSGLIRLMEAVNRLFTSSEHTGSDPRDGMQALSPRIMPVLDYIDRHLDDELSLEKLGEQFFISPSYLSTIFKKETGVNLKEYIVTKRLIQAKLLLSDGHSVSSAAELCGFRNYAHFIRSFKQYTGVSPGSYKRK